MQLKEAIDGGELVCHRLIAQYRPVMGMLARRQMHQRFRQRFDESDIVQDACWQAFQSFSTFRGSTEQEFVSWLETILRRTFTGLVQHHSTKMRDVAREWKASGTPADGDEELSVIWHLVPSDSPGPESRVIRGEKALVLASALQQLPREYQQVVELRFLEGRKLKEIADAMDSSVGRIAGLLRRGLEELHRILPSNLLGGIEEPSR
ncbi:sigma-70 family RNA polymerase sigma factor [Stieleria mannarensis]|uniref:sigma-70 family RNA polymerase sigma factor n=1 Tax=Stieleria mannarensis TaxID=2755585 RepID=UPI001C71E7C1